MKTKCRFFLLFVPDYDLGVQIITYDIPRACCIDSYSCNPVVNRSFRLTQVYMWSIPPRHLHQKQELLFPLCTFLPFPAIPFLSAFVLKEKSQRQKIFSGSLEKTRRQSGKQRIILSIHSTELLWRLFSRMALFPAYDSDSAEITGSA